MPRLIFRLLLAALAVSVTARADTSDSSDPVGALRILLRGNSDTLVSLPLQRPALVEASVQSVSGNQLTVTATVTALPTGGAYVLMMSGALEGAVLPITALTSGVLTLDPGAYDLSTLHTEIANGLSNGDLVAIIPYWTLDTLFPAGAGVVGTTSLFSIKTQILLSADSMLGINHSASAVYFYYTGGSTYSAGWYCQGNLTATCGTTRLLPRHTFIVRHPAGADTELLVTGTIPSSAYRIPVITLQANVAQDNFISLPVPLPVTLAQSGLSNSSAFVPTTSFLAVKDRLLVFDNTSITHNKSASGIYFYYTGDSSYPAGWYLFGDFSHTADTFLLNPGEGFIIRKAATATPATSVWTALPSYLQ